MRRRALQFVAGGVLLAACLACVVRPRATNAYAAQNYGTIYHASPSYQQGVLGYGSAVEGALAYGDPALPDGRVIDAYRFYGQAGQHVTITMQSPTLDTFLSVAFGPTNQVLFNDDDSAGNYDAMISAVLPYTGEYVIICTTAPPAVAVNQLRSGTYLLSVNP